MRITVALIAAAVLTLWAAPVNAAEPDTELIVHGVSTPVVCVVPMASGTRGWPVGAAIKFWNDAQPHVRFTRSQLGAECGTMNVGTFDAGWFQPRGEVAGQVHYTGWDQGRWGLDGSWFYPSVTVDFNDRHRTRPSVWHDKAFRCWKRMVVAHEFGHVLGLPHSDDPASVMTEDPACITSPAPSDVAALDAIYALR